MSPKPAASGAPETPPGAAKTPERRNRRAGVETYQNLLRVLFVLRDARPVALPGETKPWRAMTAKQITDALKHQDLPPTAGTVRKYLGQLENQIPSQVECLYGIPSREKYWRLKDNSPLNREGFSDFEAAMVCLASELLEPVLPPHLRRHLEITRERARDMLDQARPIGALPADSPLWMLKLVQRIWIEAPPAIAPAMLEAVFEAVRSRRQLAIQYHSMAARREGKPAVALTVSPIRLVQHADARLYLIAADISAAGEISRHRSQSAGYRHFALHRIVGATVSASPALANPELEQVIERQPGFGWEGKIRLLALIHVDIACRLEESPINETQRLDFAAAGQRHRLEVEIDSNWELRWWILSNGKNMQVLEPASLRDEIAAHFREGCAQYDAAAFPAG